MLARKAAEKSALLHQQGRWLKSAKGCFEVKGKTVGIIGYGHIGPQVGLLAEAFGMRVIFYDIVKKLPLGTATACTSLDELLQRADFVTLHVPETAETKGMIAERELQTMKRGSYLLNLSRGSVVELTALKTALEQGQLAGAALDVYPREPKSNDEPFDSEMRGLPNVILTPHIGGSTEEAQQNIGLEVAASLIDFMDVGSSLGAVNLPGVRLPLVNGAHRVLNFHRNVPGALSQINRVIAEMGVNIHSQQLSTQQDVGYLIMDVDSGISRDVKQKIDALDINIRTRLLF
jgi:D-3-phosphoglycerate dehydrogenase